MPGVGSAQNGEIFLLAVIDKRILQISDFGLARQLINNEYKSDGGMLPFRIMSPEAISRAKFSVKSDVYVFLLSYDLSYSWAYGVLLYEIFSLGDTPYSNMSEASILQFLIAGNRLQRPKYATDPM